MLKNIEPGIANVCKLNFAKKEQALVNKWKTCSYKIYERKKAIIIIYRWCLLYLYKTLPRTFASSIVFGILNAPFSALKKWIEKF